MAEFWEKYRDRRWQEKRLRIMERAEFRCEACGSDDSKETLHIHHGYYRSKADPWDYPDDTLWCLCEQCHEAAGEMKHDCQIELARINPAFLRLMFSLILEFRFALDVKLDDPLASDKDSLAGKIESDRYSVIKAIMENI